MIISRLCVFVINFSGNFACKVSLFRLQVVSTNVGGIPEVLPSDLILLAEPNVSCELLSLPLSLLHSPSLSLSSSSLSLSFSLFLLPLPLSVSVALVDQLEVAITSYREGSVMPGQVKHERIRELYNWSSVTERTIQVHNNQ